MCVSPPPKRPETLTTSTTWLLGMFFVPFVHGSISTKVGVFVFAIAETCCWILRKNERISNGKKGGKKKAQA